MAAGPRGAGGAPFVFGLALDRWGLRPRLRHRHRAEPGLRRDRGLLRLEDRLAGAAGRRRPQPERRGRPGAGLGRRAGRRLRPDARHTYGWKRASILAAFVNALLLLVAMGSLGWEAVHRLQSPQPCRASPSWWWPASASWSTAPPRCCSCAAGRRPQHPRRLPAHGGRRAGVGRRGGGRRPGTGLRLDLAGPGGQPADRGGHRGRHLERLFKQSLHLLFDGVPDGVDLGAVQALLESLPGVTRVHDLHVWAMGTSETR
jgi:cobalt-zinc-cadmium efflux system protein